MYIYSLCYYIEFVVITSLVMVCSMWLYYYTIYTIMSIYLEATISTVAVSCATLAHEVLRMVTDVNKTVLIEAAKAGIILTMLMELNLAKRLKYNKVSVYDNGMPKICKYCMRLFCT